MNAAVPIISVDGVTKRFAGPHSLMRRIAGKPPLAVHALNNVSLEVYRGETLGIVGEIRLRQVHPCTLPRATARSG